VEILRSEAEQIATDNGKAQDNYRYCCCLIKDKMKSQKRCFSNKYRTFLSLTYQQSTFGVTFVYSSSIKNQSSC
jgi:hypothetical protein